MRCAPAKVSMPSSPPSLHRAAASAKSSTTRAMSRSSISPRESPVQCLAYGRRTDRRERRTRVGLAPPADVAHLAHQGSAVGVDASREPLEALDDAFVVEVDLRQLPRGLGRDVGRAAEHGERNPALRLRLVIALIALARHAAVGEAAGVARAHDAVLEGEVLQAGRAGAADCSRLDEMKFRSGARVLPPATGATGAGRSVPFSRQDSGAANELQPAGLARISHQGRDPVSPSSSDRI